MVLYNMVVTREGGMVVARENLYNGWIERGTE